MQSPFHFDPLALEALTGGRSVIDLPYLRIRDREEAKKFVLAYGFDIDNEQDLLRLWTYHRKAITYIQDELMEKNNPDNDIPKILSDPAELKELSDLLLIASMKGHKFQKWACAILKVMHIYVHLENDIFSQYSSQIQDQILKPIQAEINEDPLLGTVLGAPMGENSIVLKKFETKTFKSSTSSVTKLLAKKELSAFSLLDKVGIRIVTKHLFDVFRVLKYFLDHNILSYAHNVMDQATNTLLPINILSESLESVNFEKGWTPEGIDRIIKDKIDKNSSRAKYVSKHNPFTSPDYRFLKFITRRLIRLELAGGARPHVITFFYPYEVQIMDYETHLKNMSGDAAHEKYKIRQLQSAKERLFSTKPIAQGNLT